MKNEIKMKGRAILLAFIMIVGANCQIRAQDSKKIKDKTAIKAMVGCYDVEFKYTETFSPEVDYEKAYDYTSAAFEWAELVEETEDKIVLQHLLIINDSTIIKHWRQDWIYENISEYKYNRDYHWEYIEAEKEAVEGTWTQNVYQVDDSPRYSGRATWTHVDGVSSWYHKADSPLPRREYTKRADYNVMKRGNRIQILDYGWLHEQDNDKVIRTDTSELLLAQEKGYNTYKKRDASDCSAAMKYWNQHKNMWADVRVVWDTVFDKKEDLILINKVDGKRLYEHLFFSPNAWKKAEIESLVEQYIAKDNSLLEASH